MKSEKVRNVPISERSPRDRINYYDNLIAGHVSFDSQKRVLENNQDGNLTFITHARDLRNILHTSPMDEEISQDKFGMTPTDFLAQYEDKDKDVYVAFKAGNTTQDKDVFVTAAVFVTEKDGDVHVDLLRSYPNSMNTTKGKYALLGCLAVIERDLEPGSSIIIPGEVANDSSIFVHRVKKTELVDPSQSHTHIHDNIVMQNLHAVEHDLITLERFTSDSDGFIKTKK